jgi:hypothetical protein
MSNNSRQVKMHLELLELLGSSTNQKWQFLSSTKSKGTIPNTQVSSNESWTKCHYTSSIKIFWEGKIT